MPRRLLPGFLLPMLLPLCAPGSAAAAPWTCEASGVRAALGPAPASAPVSVDSRASACSTQSAGGAPAGLPMGAAGSLLFARTRADGDASRPTAQRVSAESGLADLHIGVDLGAFKAAIQPVLDALPDIEIPEALASVRVTPAEQVRRGDTLTQHALAVRMSIAGRRVLDVAGGEASVGGTGVDCGSAVAVQALRCTKRRLVLIDVVRHRGRVRLFGAADRGFAGRRVSIVFTDTKRRVAHPRVGRDGLFRATAPLPQYVDIG